MLDLSFLISLLNAVTVHLCSQIILWLPVTFFSVTHFHDSSVVIKSLSTVCLSRALNNKLYFVSVMICSGHNKWQVINYLVKCVSQYTCSSSYCIYDYSRVSFEMVLSVKPILLCCVVQPFLLY